MTADPTTTLAAHGYRDVVNGYSQYAWCTCGEWSVAGAPPFTRAHAAHQLAVLAQEGWAVVRADVVETVAELDALPVGSVVRYEDDGSVMQLVDADCWQSIGVEGVIESLDFRDEDFPATVLYWPASGVVL